MIYENPLAEILSVHKFKVDRATAEMLCYTFNKEIKCDRKINIELFRRFAKYKPLYIFNYGGVLNYGNKDQPILLQGVEIVVPEGGEEKFMDDNSNFIFYGGPNSSLQWLDDLDEEDGHKNVYGTCRINF
jgi:hypothetical protein